MWNTIESDIRYNKDEMMNFYTDDPRIESDSIINEHLYASEAKKIEDEIKFSIGRAAVFLLNIGI